MQEANISISQFSPESEIISLDAGFRLDGIPAFDLWDMVMEVLRSPNSTKAPIEPVSRYRCETGDRDAQQLSQLNFVLANAHSFQGESQLYIFEDNEAVINMII